jgi:isocitrate dehydrogenase
MIFREHTEDVYSEIEWKKGSPEAKQVINFINNEMGKKGENAIRPDSSVGIKPISATATKRVIRLALEYAIKHKRRSCTFVHKGNVMRLTEGSFRDWGYELAKKEFGDYIVTEQEMLDDHNGEAPRGRVIVRDRLADQVFQQMLLRPDDYDVIATTNMNGDYIASMALAMVGDPGIAPVAYVGAKAAIFQAAQSAARSETGEDVNPSSVLLAGVMLFEHLGWKDSAELVAAALMRTVADGTVTYDLARKVDGAKLLRAPEFCDRLIENFEEVRKSRVRQAMERAAIRV